MVILVRLVLIAILMSCAELGQAEDQVPAKSTEPASLSLQQNVAVQSVSEKSTSNSITVGSKSDASLIKHSSGNFAQSTALVKPANEQSYSDLVNLLLAAALIIMVIIFLSKITPVLIDYFAPQLQALGIVPILSPKAWPKTLAEEKDFTKFIVEFQAGPASASPTAPPPANPPVEAALEKEIENPVKKDGDPLKEFFRWVPAQMIDLHYLVDRINRSQDKRLKREKLNDLAYQIRSLKAKAILPELLPIWQMASALDGLVKQLIDRADTITQSTLRTITGGISLLGELCVPELRVDIASNPPIRILAVDDDQVTRFALTASLKKAFDQPDLAENGEVALTLAGQQTFDIIFMDVNMPGMDGFEVCSKIHQMPLNAATPVVFVTSLKDFESHAKSIVSGGSDLIGKPFLTFEIAVKALTLILHARLKTRGQLVEGSNATSSPEIVAASPQVIEGVPAVDSALSTTTGSTVREPNALEKLPSATQPATPKCEPAQPPSTVEARVEKAASHPGATGGSPNKFSMELLWQVSASLTEIRNEIRVVGQTQEGAQRGEKLVALYLRIQSLTRQIDLPELRPAFLLCSALQGLLNKLQEKPANASVCTLDTAVTALDLLKDLCVKGVRTDLATTPAISMLVVDDEPLARRAIVTALQTAFLKPHSAETGEAALMLATENTFDVIFLDVQMPGMDGFTVCKTLHDKLPNFTTPVVFVTSHIDSKARVQSAQSGGSDFVVKPFLFAEITVKALTFALRARLQKSGIGGKK